MGVRLFRTTGIITTMRGTQAILENTNKYLSSKVRSIYVNSNPIVSSPAASLGPVVLYTTQASETGHWAAILTLITTTAGTGGTCTVTLTYNNGSAVQNVTSSSIALNTLGSEAQLVQSFYQGGGSNISYTTSVAAATGSPAYTLRIKLEFMG